MPFTRSFSISLTDYVPDDDHDPHADLVQIRCNSHCLYAASLGDGIWRVDSELMPDSILASFMKQKSFYPSVTGVRIDQAHVGKPLLLSLVDFDWHGIWCSKSPVNTLTPVHRSEAIPRGRNLFAVEENRL